MLNSTGPTSGTGTAYPSGAPEFTPGFMGIRATRSLVYMQCFVDLCLSFFFQPLCCMFFFFQPLCCMFFLDLRILITHFLSSNSIWIGSVNFSLYYWLQYAYRYSCPRNLQMTGRQRASRMALSKIIILSSRLSFVRFIKGDITLSNIEPVKINYVLQPC